MDMARLQYEVGRRRARALLALVRAQGTAGITTAAAARSLGWDPRVVRRYVQRLEAEGLIRRPRPGVLVAAGVQSQPHAPQPRLAETRCSRESPMLPNPMPRPWAQAAPSWEAVQERRAAAAAEHLAYLHACYSDRTFAAAAGELLGRPDLVAAANEAMRRRARAIANGEWIPS